MSDSDDLIYFRGPWQEDERQMLRQVVAEVEQSKDDASTVLGKPWVCVRMARGESMMYMASRARHAHVLHAPTAEGLVERIAGRFL